MARITINGVSLDPIAHAQALGFAGLTSPDASTSDYILIQTSAPLTPTQKDQLAGMGVDIHEYVSDNTYLCGYKGTDLASIRALPYVTWANVYLRGFKVAPNLRSQAASPAAHILPMGITEAHSNTPHTVDIVFHEDVDTSSDALKTAVAAAARVAPDTLPIGRRKVRLTVQEKYLDSIGIFIFCV